MSNSGSLFAFGVSFYFSDGRWIGLGKVTYRSMRRPMTTEDFNTNWLLQTGVHMRNGHPSF